MNRRHWLAGQPPSYRAAQQFVCAAATIVLCGALIACVSVALGWLASYLGAL